MADGSQLRRRVRMATADEPVDTDAIANQTASELRQQIEASPIPSRLERVVQEDRPLASRAISAETPLVEEPDDSPSAREVSFHLAAPTGRGAVRSALRTPGLSADLRPRTPFGEDETGIAPEPAMTAKPEAADLDILEPEQPDRSPAGPDRDATAQGESTDELQELHKAQRHDRRARIGAGVLRGVQALASMIGGAANIPGLSALGGLSGVASGVIPQGAGVADFEQRHALSKEATQARQRAEQQAYERAQDADRAKRAERQLEVNVENAETGHRMSESRWQEQQRMNRLAEDEQRSRLDPSHQAAANARGVFSSFLESVAREKPELREDFADVVENLPTMSASQIESAIDELHILRNAPQGTRRGGRGGRGPGGGGDRRPSGTDVTPEQQAAYDRLVDRYSVISGDEPATIRAAFSDIAYALNPEETGSLISRVGRGGAQDVNAQQQQAARIAAMSTPGTPEFENAIRQYGEDLRKPRGRYLNLGAILTAMSRLNPAQQIAALRSDSAAAAAGATEARSAIWAALNSYFHENGGANIVDSEMSRYMSAFGAGSITSPPSSFIAAIQRDANRARGDMEHEAARFPRAVVDEFRNRSQGRRR